MFGEEKEAVLTTANPSSLKASRWAVAFLVNVISSP